MSDGRVVAWLHTMHMEGGQETSRLSMSKANPFGKRGKDYDPSYEVTSEPLVPLSALQAAEQRNAELLAGLVGLADAMLMQKSLFKDEDSQSETMNVYWPDMIEPLIAELRNLAAASPKDRKESP